VPATSKAQARAMFAAAEGKSTLGIPKKVGKEFSAATQHVKGLPEYVHRRKVKRSAAMHKP
jgi:hypothetical protein